jgi:hypothetical protein
VPSQRKAVDAASAASTSGMSRDVADEVARDLEAPATPGGAMRVY